MSHLYLRIAMSCTQQAQMYPGMIIKNLLSVPEAQILLPIA